MVSKIQCSVTLKTYVTPDDSTTKAPKPKKGGKEMQSM